VVSIAPDLSQDLELLGMLQKRLAELDVHAEVREHLLSLVVLRDSRLPVYVFISGGGRFYCWDSGRNRKHVTDVDQAAAHLAALAASQLDTGPQRPHVVPGEEPGGEMPGVSCAGKGSPTRSKVVTFERSYAGTEDQVRHVRADLASIVKGCPLADDFILLASELATNAVVHSESGQPGGTFSVRAEIRSGDYAWLEVEDQGGPWIRQDPDEEHGRGLVLVANLAGDGNWAVEDGRTSGTRAIWVWLDWGSSREPSATVCPEEDSQGRG
jgi:anti-sigma regulatory factor (Ser/Thr protein kinase)